MKLILDTNVIVSALISNSIPSKILYDFVLSEKVEIFLSDDVFEEYVEVLHRDKFTKYPNFVAKTNIVLNRLYEISNLYNPIERIGLLRDSSDNKFLELADASSSDYLITGNTLDFTISEYKGTKIVTPREFWDSLKKR